MEIKKILEQLRNKLESSRISVMVGAGFSKNVSHLYPSWSQLLYDLTIEMYQEEFQESFQHHIKSTFPRKRLTRGDYFKQAVEKKIKSVGYLRIVSEYIRYKGTNEAITTYIEARTPQLLTDDDNNWFLHIDNQRHPIKSDDLKLHRLLLQLPWHNVYTTNYDNTLERCTPISEELIDKRIASVNLEIDELKAEKSTKSKQIADIKSQDKIDRETPANFERSSISKENDSLSKVENLETDTDKIQELNDEIYNINLKINRKKEAIRLLNESKNDLYNTVCSAPQLNLSKSRNIIKLHGSLRNDADRISGKYGFDGNSKINYIISEEDYASYQRDHEAFTQLMRISILQESLCLIGFSGTDPNFLAWISWVRDILERDTSNTQTQNRDYKIYLIDTNSKPLAESIRLFYENHKIARIPLCDEKTLTELVNSSSQHTPKTKLIKHSFELLFKYLGSSMVMNTFQMSLEQIQRSEYNKSWGDVRKTRANRFIFSPQEMDSFYDQGFHNLPDYYGNISTLYKYYLLKQSLPQIRKAKKDKKENLDSWAKVIIMGLEDSLIPIDRLWSEEEINDLKTTINNNFFLLAFQKYEVRTAVLLNRLNMLESCEKIPSDRNIFEDILQKHFNFDFCNAKIQLDNWHPKSTIYKQRKAGLLSYFDIGQSRKLLQEMMISIDTLSVQQQLCLLELYQFISNASHKKYEEETTEYIKVLKKFGGKPIRTLLKKDGDTVGSHLHDRVMPYERGRFSASNPIVKNDIEEVAKNIQLLQVLLNNGFPLKLNYTSLIRDSEWYEIFESGFESYPYPFLFYCVQYENQDFLKRVGQDYAFSDRISSDIENICQRLLVAYNTNDCPISFKNSILLILSEILISVDPKIWEFDFITIWNNLKNKEAFSDTHLTSLAFINKSLKFIRQRGNIVKITVDILKLFESNSDRAISYLYTLANNPIGKKMRLSTKKDKILMEDIDELIAKLKEGNEIIIFALGNLHHLMSAKQKQSLIANLAKYDLKSIKSERLWRVLLAFVGTNRDFHNKIKEAILDNHRLWYTGIKGRTRSGPNDLIPLTDLTRGKKSKYGVIWNRNEILLLYERLKPAFNSIKKLSNRNDPFFSYSDHLYEMLSFLTYGKHILEADSEYNELLKTVSSLLNEDRGYQTIKEGLLSDEKKPYIFALSDLSSSIYENKDTNYTDEVELVINVALLGRQEVIEASLAYIAVWVGDKYRINEMKALSNKLTAVLEKFQKTELKGYDIPFLTEKLVRIASALKKWNISNDNVTHWLKYGENSRFNNIKNVIREMNILN